MSEYGFNQNKGLIYSHAGRVSLDQYSYLLDKKSHIDNILAGKKRNKIVEVDFIDKEETLDEFDQINENEFEDIFSNEYKIRHLLDLKEQRQKFFSNVKNPCTFIESKVKNKNKTKKKSKKNLINMNPLDNKLIAKEELKKLMYSNYRFGYYYHLLHHTDNSNYYIENNNNNSVISGPSVNATRYNPKLDFIFPKLIYSPSFKFMSGRYDQEILSKNIRNNIEKNKLKRKEMERLKRMEKIKNLVNSKIETKYKNPTFYNEKNNDFIKNNEKLREIKELKRSKSFIIDSPMIKDKIIGDVEMEKQLQRGMLPEHNDVRIRIEKAFHNILDKYENKTIEQLGNTSNTYKGSGINDNNTKNNEQSLINNKSNNNLNNNSSNINETIYTSNALKNEAATLYNNNINDSNTNSNINIEKIEIKNNNINHKLKNLNNIKIKYRKINSFKKKNFQNFRENKKTIYNSSSVSNFFIDNKMDKQPNHMNKTLGINSVSTKNNYNNHNHRNNLINNIISKTTKTINFEKMLSREYLDNQRMDKEPLHPQVSPKYDIIQPKCIMKVVYSKKTYYPKNTKNFEGMGEDITFDIDKVFYKYNNHFPAKSFYFDKMTGRANSIDGYPSYMVNLYNRYSCLNFNNKSFKMNNYSEGKLEDQRSSFNQHKSFNWKLNMNKLNLNEINKLRESSDISKIYKKISGANSMKNLRRKKIRIPGQNYLSVYLKKNSSNDLPEYYQIDLDKIEKNKEYLKNKIDGITLKTYIKPNNANSLLSEKDKRLFLMNITSN